MASLLRVLGSRAGVSLRVRSAAPYRVFSNTTNPAASSEEEQLPFEQATIADLLRARGAGNDGSWLWCTTDDTVFDAVKSMTSHNVGALLVMRPDTSGTIAGIVTERDYLRKIIVQGRSSKTTKVGDIMTDENKLITLTPETRLLKAMEIMSDKRIRHIPVVEGQKMKGMLSIGDVVAAVVEEHREEVKRLSEYIKGSY
ncbi:unnamed protein product [Closterium sp. NIES-53]